MSIGDVNIYNITGLICNTPYYYRVRAFNSCGTSISSNTITLTTSACALSGTVSINHTDIDVDNAGRLFVARGSCTAPALRFYDPSGSFLSEVAATPAPPACINCWGGPYVFASRSHQNVILAWACGGSATPGDNGIYAVIYNKNTQTITKPTFQVLNISYGEFFDLVVDDNGNFVVAANDYSTTFISWYNAAGTLIQSQSFANSGYGTHLALNRTTGAGIIVCHNSHSGDVLYYRRWDSGLNWIDPSLVHVPAGYIYWYDGGTVGMNDNGEFAIEWRYDQTTMKYATYNSSGTMVSGPTTFSSKSGYYDPYRYRHNQVQIDGNNFILGETSDVTGNLAYFQYTPAGTLVNSYTTTYMRTDAMTHRFDGLGRSFFSDGNTIYYSVVF